jgi:hypothetical protein
VLSGKWQRLFRLNPLNWARITVWSLHRPIRIDLHVIWVSVPPSGRADVDNAVKRIAGWLLAATMPAMSGLAQGGLIMGPQVL